MRKIWDRIVAVHIGLGCGLAGVLVVPFAGYALQVAIVLSCRAFPIEKAEDGGKIYQITRGFGGRGDWTPFFGLQGFLPHSQVLLTVSDKRTGEILERENFDDWRFVVYGDYRKVFRPEHAQ